MCGLFRVFRPQKPSLVDTVSVPPEQLEINGFFVRTRMSAIEEVIHAVFDKYPEVITLPCTKEIFEVSECDIIHVVKCCCDQLSCGVTYFKLRN
jgi:hypothetical protein